MSLVHRIISVQIPTISGVQVKSLSVAEGLKLARESMQKEWMRFSSLTYQSVAQSPLEASQFTISRLFLKTWLDQSSTHSLATVEGKWLYHLGSAMLNELGGMKGLRDTIQCLQSSQDPMAPMLAAQYHATLVSVGFTQARIQAGNDPLQMRFSWLFKQDINTALAQIPANSFSQYQGMGRFQAAVQAIESRSVAHFQKMAQTVHGLAEKLPQIRSGISIRPSLAAQFDQLRDPGFRSLLVSNDQNLPRYLAECHGQNGQNVFGVVTHLRDTLWTLEVVKAVLRADGASKPPATQRQTASTMVRTLFELEKPVLKMVHWVQSTPRHRALDWQTAILLDDIAELVRLVWDFGGNTTPGMVKARDRWLTALNSVATSCVCTIS